MDIRWKKSLALIREQLKNDHVYNTWFADIQLQRYDEPSNTVVLCVPSKYVMEFVELTFVRQLGQILAQTFKPGVNLSYVVREADFSQCVDYLRTQGFSVGAGIPRFQIPNARKRLEDGLHYYLGDRAQWLPVYDKVANWLTDNKGRGLLCVGASGLGKTLICTKILPVILGHNVTSVTAMEMNTRIDQLLNERVIVIDDLGKESVSTVNYGNRRTPFFELCDAAERQGKLLVITTNLSTTPFPGYPDSIQHRYGEPVLSRLQSTTCAVEFKGDGFRGTTT